MIAANDNSNCYMKGYESAQSYLETGRISNPYSSNTQYSEDWIRGLQDGVRDKL